MAEEKSASRGAVLTSAEVRHARARWSLSDEELADRAQAGSGEAFAELVDRFGGRLEQFLRRKVGNAHDAEDLVQDTFLKAYRYLPRYKGPGRFSTWLFTIAHRLASSHYRHNAARDNGEMQSEQVPQPYEVLIRKEIKQGLWDAARLLPENQFEALWLKYAEDLSVKEIARVMAKSPVHVKVLLYRARRNLAARLSGELGAQETQRPQVRRAWACL